MLPRTTQTGVKLLSTAALPRISTTPLRPAVVLPHHQRPLRCPITTTLIPQNPQLRHLKINLEYAGGWSHPIYTDSQMHSIKIAHRTCKTWSDWAALSAVRLLRFVFDTATGYKHDKAVALGRKDPEAATQRFAMTEEKWLTRFIFLESIAGVPGMVGGMVRHLQSLRVLRRDNGWIATLLEESQNERMHLLTFLEFRKPGPLMRLSILGGQGVFFNLFFAAYLLSPKTCHRFVGYIEEEAVITYTRTIADLEAGKLPKWENLEAPEEQIAKDYFRLEPGKDKVKNLLIQIRADEAKHREVNHTLANLAQTDMNPYAAQWPEGVVERPTTGLATIRQTGWEKEELGRLAKTA